MTREEELTLIRRFQSGDENAFDELIEIFRTKGYSLAYQWTNNQHDALDVLQDSFIKMFKVLPKWKPESSLFTWLYRVIVNRAIDLKRRKGRMKLISTETSMENSSEGLHIASPKLGQPDVQAEASELGGMIYEAVSQLPRRQKEVFILKNYEGMPLKEIAGLLEISLGTVKANLFQAVRKLRESLAGYMKGQVKEDE